MKVCEIFYSLQGEGPNVGYPAVFVRLAGCNVRCEMCDSKYSWEEGKDMSVDAVIKEITKYKAMIMAPGLVITGGEPLVQQDEVIELCRRMNGLARFINIETNGTIPVSDELVRYAKIIISPKIGNLGVEVGIHPKNVRNDVYYKFVVKNISDVDKITEKYYMLPQDKIYIMPEGTVSNSQLYEKLWHICKQYGWILSPRLHILVWGNVRGV
jgi:organic radical activating enzyme